MSHQNARVVACGPGYVEVEVIETTGCSACSLNQGCGVGSLSRLFGQRQQAIRLPSDKSFAVGQSLILQFHENALIWGAALQYLLPIVLMLLVAASLTLANQPEAMIATISILALLFGLWSSRWLARHWLKHKFSIRLSESLL